MLQALDVYRWLMGAESRPACEAFDAHVVGAVLALSVDGTRRGVSLSDSLGLSPSETAELVGSHFPHAQGLFTGLSAAVAQPASEDELCLRDLLWRGSTERTELERKFAVIIARRAQLPNHLWQDLGLRHRRELSWLMSRHFEPLANKNSTDMKWKKFLYRTICRDASYSLCVSPTCSECTDYDGCFGEEAGESLLSAPQGGEP
jgi:nitrogen fixation protein NifQ